MGEGSGVRGDPNLKTTYPAKTWRDPRPEIRLSPIQGMGVFANELMRRGEIAEIMPAAIDEITQRLERDPWVFARPPYLPITVNLKSLDHS